MRTQTKSDLVQLSFEEINNLIRIVEEKIAHNTQHKQKKSFKTIDLWRIQRRKKKVKVRNFLAGL